MLERLPYQRPAETEDDEDGAQRQQCLFSRRRSLPIGDRAVPDVGLRNQEAIGGRDVAEERRVHMATPADVKAIVGAAEH